MFLDEADSSLTDDSTESKYAFLASDTNMGAAGTDFSNPTALLRRQREILSKIETHKAKDTAKFDPLKILKHSAISLTTTQEEE